jgi:hypothetical protein
MRLAGGDAHATHGGVNVRHRTDFDQFDGGETIQPELIDMCRWILSWFGGDAGETPALPFVASRNRSEGPARETRMRANERHTGPTRRPRGPRSLSQ